MSIYTNNNHTLLRSKGFTLIELMVAFSISLLVVTMFVYLFVEGVKQTRVIVDSARQVSVASELTEVLTYHIRTATEAESFSSATLLLRKASGTDYVFEHSVETVQLDGQVIHSPIVPISEISFMIIGDITVQISYTIESRLGAPPLYGTTTISMRN